jgi:hypothetical protein
VWDALHPGMAQYYSYRKLGGSQILPGRGGGVEKPLASTGIRSPDHAARSEVAIPIIQSRSTTTKPCLNTVCWRRLRHSFDKDYLLWESENYDF